MIDEFIIEAENISKTFRIPHEKHATLKQAALGFLNFKKKAFTDLDVLKEVSFNIKKGEFFGILGKNGSGKSTLLKILAGIYTYSGKLTIHGRISPFLELGVGFNPELTGYENIYLNGAILGLTKKEVDEKLEEIIDFAELEQFMDQKLKNYSSGMQLRLAFSVAIHAHAPIILLDEVLAVGDIRFQEKCFRIFKKMKEEGRTIVFVSHDMSAMEKFCDRILLLNEGKAVDIAEPKKIVMKYKELMGINRTV